MEKKLQVQELLDLCGLDIDAGHCYRAAVKNIEVYEIRERLNGFLSDHMRHISELSDLIRKMDGIAPIDMPAGGLLTGKLHMVASRERTEETMRDMLANERIVNGVYGEAFEKDLGAEASALVERIYSDEKCHLEYLEQTVKARLWERVPVSPLTSGGG